MDEVVDEAHQEEEGHAEKHQKTAFAIIVGNEDTTQRSAGKVLQIKQGEI